MLVQNVGDHVCSYLQLSFILSFFYLLSRWVFIKDVDHTIVYDELRWERLEYILLSDRKCAPKEYEKNTLILLYLPGLTSSNNKKAGRITHRQEA